MDTKSCAVQSPLGQWADFLNHLHPVTPESLPHADPQKFHGCLRLAHLGNLSISILSATEHRLHSKPTSISGKLHNKFILIVPINGCIVVRQNCNSIPVDRDRALLFNISYPAEIVYLVPSSCLQVIIPATRLCHLQDILPEGQPLVVNCRYGLGMILRNQSLGLFGGLTDISCEKVCHALGQQLVNLLAVTIQHNGPDIRALPPEKRHLAAIFAAIDRQLEDPQISTDSVAKAVCISRSYLFKLLKRHHTSFRQEVLSRRLSRAKQLLKDPNQNHLPISDIAWRLGFNSHSHFSRTFQKATGVTPSDFRKQKNMDRYNQNLELNFHL